MTLASIADYVCKKVGKTDSTSVAICKDFIRQRHEMVYDTGLWKDSIKIEQFCLSTKDSPDSNPYTTDAVNPYAYEQEITLPYEIARPIAVLYETTLMSCRDLQALVRIQPEAMFSEGVPASYTEIEPIAFGKSTSSDPFRVMLRARSSSADDGKTVYFKGILDGRPVSETFVLSTTSRYGSQEFDEVHYVSKPVTSGTITFSNGAIDQVIPAEETRYSLCRLRLSLVPEYVSGEQVCMIVVGKKRLRPLRNDYDDPQIRGIDNALIAFAEGDMLERSRQFGKAQIKFSEASSLLEIVRDLERGQSSAVSVLQPNPDGAYTRDDFGF